MRVHGGERYTGVRGTRGEGYTGVRVHGGERYTGVRGTRG